MRSTTIIDINSHPSHMIIFTKRLNIMKVEIHLKAILTVIKLLELRRTYWEIWVVLDAGGIYPVQSDLEIIC